MTNSSQSSTDTLTYDAWGNATQTGSSVVPFGYGGGQGYQSDTDSGLKLLGNRYYDSDSGRFLSQDPAQNGNNWYAYAGNNPLRHTDPTGLTVGDGGSSDMQEAPKPDPTPFVAFGPPAPTTDLSKPPYTAPAGFEWFRNGGGLWVLRNIATGATYLNGRNLPGGSEPQPVGGKGTQNGGGDQGKSPSGSPPPGTPTNQIPIGKYIDISRSGRPTNSTVDGGSAKLPLGGGRTITVQGNKSGIAIIFSKVFNWRL